MLQPLCKCLLLALKLLYTLSHHPVEADKLYQSLLAAGLTPNGEITADDLSMLEYLDWVRGW